MQALATEIEAVDRELIDTEFGSEPGKAPSLERTSPAPREYLWSVPTDAANLNQWFLPVTGDLHEGGSYAFDGNAEGATDESVEHERFRRTWVYGGGLPSLGGVDLKDDGDGCQVPLLHTADVATIVLFETSGWGA